MHTPPWQASLLARALRSTRYVGEWSSVVFYSDLWQVSPVVQAFPSSHGVLSGSGVPAQTPPSQVSLLVRSEERRVGKEWRSAAWPRQVTKWQVSEAVQAMATAQGAPVGEGPTREQ